MLKNYVVTVIGYKSGYGHDLITMLLQAHSSAEANGYGLEEFEQNYPNHNDIKVNSFEITEDMIKI